MHENHDFDHDTHHEHSDADELDFEWELEDDDPEDVATTSQIQEKAQKLPQIGLNGKRLPSNLEFFAIPSNIGEILQVHSDLKYGTKEPSEKNRSTGIILSVLFGGMLGLGAVLGAKVEDPLIIVALIVVPILIGTYFAIQKYTFFHRNLFVGTEGFAEYECTDRRTNITLKKEVRFDQITDLQTEFVSVIQHGIYRNSEFTFRWMNEQRNAILHLSKGIYNRNQPENKPLPLIFAECCERAYVRYRMARLDARIAQQGYESFYHCTHQGNTLTEYIRLTRDSITFIKGSREHTTYQLDDLKALASDGPYMIITRKSVRGKDSNDPDLIPIQEMTNFQYLLWALFTQMKQPIPGYNLESTKSSN